MDAPHEHGGQEERRGVEEEDDLHARRAHEQGPEGRAEEEGQALDRAGRAVGGGELLGAAGERRHPRHLGRAEDAADEGEHRRHDEDDGIRRVGDERDRRDGGEHGPHEVAADEDELAREPVREGCPDGRDDRHQEVAHRHPDADEARPADPVRPHDDRRGVRPVADHRPGEGELDAPQRRVAEDGSQRGPRVADGSTHHTAGGGVLVSLDSHLGSLHLQDGALTPVTIPGRVTGCP